MSFTDRLWATVESLRIPNFRRFFLGQVVSLSGTWMQRVAQSWLVLELTDSATLVGVVVALQAIPIVVLGPWGGVVADRVDKRRMIMWLQVVMGLPAFWLGLMTLRGDVRVWHVMAVAAALGTSSAFERPARHAFLFDMVGAGRLPNAVSLNSILPNAARAVGPAIGGAVIAAAGSGWCFVANGATFLAALVAYSGMKVSELERSERGISERGHLRRAATSIRRSPMLLAPIAMLAVAGALVFQFEVTLPLLARDVFGQGAETFGLMTSSMGAGAIVGGLVTASRARLESTHLIQSAVLLGMSLALVAWAPDLRLSLLALFAVGAAGVYFTATCNSAVQLSAEASMRGSIVALSHVAFFGSRPIGGPLLGWLAELTSVRTALLIGGLACLVAAGVGTRLLRPSAELARAGSERNCRLE